MTREDFKSVANLTNTSDCCAILPCVQCQDMAYRGSINADLQRIGCVFHATTKEGLVGIFRVGLLLGGSLTHDARAETYFGIYFPDDPRREIRGRVGQTGYDVTIVFDSVRLARSCDLFLSSNGVLLTKQPVSPLTYYSIIEHGYNLGDKRLLYHELLMKEKIHGFYADSAQVTSTSGRTVAGAIGDNAPPSGRTAAVRGASRSIPDLSVL